MNDFDPNDRGEYPVGPEPAPNPRPFGAPRVRIRTSMMGYDAPGEGKPIPYARPMPAPQSPEPSISTQLQYALGLLSPFAAGVLLWVANGSIAVLRLPYSTSILATWILFGVFVAMVVYVSAKLHWKAFLPGVLTTILIIPLIFFVVCGVAFVALAGPGGFR